MLDEDVRVAIREVEAAFGSNPLGYFWLLQLTGGDHLDYDAVNRLHDNVRNKSWHSLRLHDYRVWALSDNGDMLWWNGDQTIAMDGRAREFVSVAVRPLQFMKLVSERRYSQLFPDELLDG